jgi:hypothetical protein
MELRREQTQRMQIHTRAMNDLQMRNDAQSKPVHFPQNKIQTELACSPPYSGLM